jgi:transcriptional regulator with XRE-family HTH domain
MAGQLRDNARAATTTAVHARSPWNEKTVPKILALIKAGQSLREAAPTLGVNYSRLTGFVRTHPALRNYAELVRRNSFASSQRKNSAFGDREICQIAKLIERGKTRKSIADEMGVSRGTVEKTILKNSRLRKLRGLATVNAWATLSQSRQKLTAQNIPQIRQLLIKHFSLKRIAEQLEVDRNTLSAFVRSHPQLRITRQVEMYVAIASTFSGPYFKLGVTRSGNRHAYYSTHHAVGAFIVLVRFKAPILVELEYHNRNIRWNDFRGARKHEFYKLFLKGKPNPAFVELAQMVKLYCPRKNLIRALDKLLSGNLPLALGHEKSLRPAVSQSSAASSVSDSFRLRKYSPLRNWGRLMG